MGVSHSLKYALKLNHVEVMGVGGEKFIFIITYFVDEP